MYILWAKSNLNLETTTFKITFKFQLSRIGEQHIIIIYNYSTSLCTCLYEARLICLTLHVQAQYVITAHMVVSCNRRDQWRCHMQDWSPYWTICMTLHSTQQHAVHDQEVKQSCTRTAPKMHTMHAIVIATTLCHPLERTADSHNQCSCFALFGDSSVQCTLNPCMQGAASVLITCKHQLCNTHIVYWNKAILGRFT